MAKRRADFWSRFYINVRDGRLTFGHISAQATVDRRRADYGMHPCISPKRTSGFLVTSLHKRPWLGAEPVPGTNITSIIKPGHPAAAKQRASARCFCVSCAVAAVFVVACRKRRHGECKCQDETNDDEFLFHGFFPKVVKIMIYQFSRTVNKDIFVPRCRCRPLFRRFSGYVRYAGRVRGSSPDPASKCARISTR